jgi:uncharacterized protein involved in response to NO
MAKTDPEAGAAADAGVPVFFANGFRTFFLSAGVWAALAVPIWLAMFHGLIVLPTAMDPVTWHVHEMLFGFAAAAIAGFLLTAMPNWTGTPGLMGAPLAALFALWLAGRVLIAASAVVGGLSAALADLSFLAVLAVLAAYRIAASRNWRNLVVVVLVLILLSGNVLFHGAAFGLGDTGGAGRRLSIAALIMLISLIGGRVVPAFTRNWLASRGHKALPPQPERFDALCLAILFAALAMWVAVPDFFLAGAGLIVAGFLSLARLARWHGHRTFGEPLVWALHAGFAWLPVCLALTGLGTLGLFSQSAGLHALTTGAIAAMIVAVMTRATLGHSGGTLTADRTTTLIYILIMLAAALRVFAGAAAEYYAVLLGLSALFWTAAFVLFVIHYGRRLLSAR